MVSGLFRQRVVEKQADRLHGEILLLPRFSHSLIISVLLGWVLALIVWLCTSSYARKETVQGWIEPAAGVVRVYPERTGTIKSVLVQEGDRVTEGQPLLVVNGDRILEDGEHLESILLAEYESQKRILTEQLQRSERMHTQQQLDLEQRISSSLQDLALLERQIQMQTKRYRLIAEQAERYRSLREMGHISSAEMDAVVAQELELDAGRKSLERSQVNLKNKIQRLENEKALLPEQHANNVAQPRVTVRH